MKDEVTIISLDAEDNYTFDTNVCGNLTEEYKRVSLSHIINDINFSLSLPFISIQHFFYTSFKEIGICTGMSVIDLVSKLFIYI